MVENISRSDALEMGAGVGTVWGALMAGGIAYRISRGSRVDPRVSMLGAALLVGVGGVLGLRALDLHRDAPPGPIDMSQVMDDSLDPWTFLERFGVKYQLNDLSSADGSKLVTEARCLMVACLCQRDYPQLVDRLGQLDQRLRISAQHQSTCERVQQAKDEMILRWQLAYCDRSGDSPPDLCFVLVDWYCKLLAMQYREAHDAAARDRVVQKLEDLLSVEPFAEDAKLRDRLGRYIWPLHSWLTLPQKRRVFPPLGDA